MQLLLGPLANQVASSPGMVLGMLAALFAGKFMAAAIAAALFGYSNDQRGLMWSLTLPQVAATLAAAFVAFEVKDAKGTRLIDEPVISAVLVLMLVTAILGPILTAQYATRLATKSNQSNSVA